VFQSDFVEDPDFLEKDLEDLAGDVEPETRI
jgi:hypothetical protein